MEIKEKIIEIIKKINKKSKLSDEELLMKKLTLGKTNKILKKLKDYGFNVTEPAGYGNYGVKIIDNVYFNEKINEALGITKPRSRL